MCREISIATKTKAILLWKQFWPQKSPKSISRTPSGFMTSRWASHWMFCCPEWETPSVGYTGGASEALEDVQPPASSCRVCKFPPWISVRFPMRLSRACLLRSEQNTIFFERSVMTLQIWMKQRVPRTHPARHQESRKVQMRDCKSQSSVSGAQIQNCFTLSKRFSALFSLSLP